MRFFLSFRLRLYYLSSFEIISAAFEERIASWLLTCCNGIVFS
jgi:hypothetical protein